MLNIKNGFSECKRYEIIRRTYRVKEKGQNIMEVEIQLSRSQ